MANDDRYKGGVEMRRTVLGAEHVERSLSNSSSFARPIQELVTEYCWGAVWTRPGLTLRDRSLLNMAMLTALNRPEELELHVRGALNNGCTEQEIQEVLLQTAVYCGVPAAISAFRIAQQVVERAREGRDGDSPARAEGADGDAPAGAEEGDDDAPA